MIGSGRGAGLTTVMLMSALLLRLSASVLAQPPVAPIALPAAALVMPFQVSPRDPRTVWLGEGAALLVTEALRSAGGAAIGRDERLAALDRLRVPNVATLSYATVIRVAEVVAADVAIVGAIEVAEDQIIVRARRIQVEAGHLLGEIVEQGAIGDFLAIIDRVAAGLTPGSAASPRPPRPAMAAFEHYVNGLVARNPERGIALFSRALATSPTFQEARLALAEARAAQGNHRLAVEEAQRVPDAHRLARRARFLGALSLLELGRLPEAFDAFPRVGACEIHLATDFQNMVYEHPQFPADLKAEMYAWIRENATEERKPKDTEEQFIYKARKKAIGPFKKRMWSIEPAARQGIGKSLEERFSFLMRQLKIDGTADAVATFVKVTPIANDREAEIVAAGGKITAAEKKAEGLAD